MTSSRGYPPRKTFGALFWIFTRRQSTTCRYRPQTPQSSCCGTHLRALHSSYTKEMEIGNVDNNGDSNLYNGKLALPPTPDLWMPSKQNNTRALRGDFGLAATYVCAEVVCVVFSDPLRAKVARWTHSRQFSNSTFNRSSPKLVYISLLCSSLVFFPSKKRATLNLHVISRSPLGARPPCALTRVPSCAATTQAMWHRVSVNRRTYPLRCLLSERNGTNPKSRLVAFPAASISLALSLRKNHHHGAEFTGEGSPPPGHRGGDGRCLCLLGRSGGSISQ